MDGWMVGCMSAQMNRQMDEWMRNEWMGGRGDEWMGGKLMTSDEWSILEMT